ncbi:MAG: methionyl-tRNA formyltransferase [Alphaproteobacteria bacterium]|nr:methionyl-tRNA formyltransferase [Alphaproteobacteria bacterium]
MTKPLRIAFMGTPDFSVPALAALHEGPHDIVCVYSQPPRPKGRGHKVQPSPVHAYADQHGIPVYHPTSFKPQAQKDTFADHNLDVAVVVAYGLILPQAVLDAPKYGCINIHGSLLPRWRGASPIQRSIWEGDAETGVTLMQMDQGLDTGPEIAKQSIAITKDTTAQTLHDALSQLGSDMIVGAMDTLAKNGNLPSTPQDDSLSNYAPLLTKEDGKIDWSQSAQQIDRQIRALNPWPGTYTGQGQERIKIQSADINAEKSDKPAGTILDKKGNVACGQGTILTLKSIQPPGKKSMDFASALNGNYVAIGDIFS